MAAGGRCSRRSPGTGLRIQEALDLQRRHVNLARGTLTVERSKTDAGVRVVDLTPGAPRRAGAVARPRPFKEPTDLVFPTLKGEKDSRQNVRRRLLSCDREGERGTRGGRHRADRHVPPHGLRRTFASLRVAAGDDPVYVSSQIGHEDPTFTLRVYAQVVKHRERLTAEGAGGVRARQLNGHEWAQTSL